MIRPCVFRLHYTSKQLHTSVFCVDTVRRRVRDGYIVWASSSRFVNKPGRDVLEANRSKYSPRQRTGQRAVKSKGHFEPVETQVLLGVGGKNNRSSSGTLLWTLKWLCSRNILIVSDHANLKCYKTTGSSTLKRLKRLKIELHNIRKTCTCARIQPPPARTDEHRRNSELKPKPATLLNVSR